MSKFLLSLVCVLALLGSSFAAQFAPEVEAVLAEAKKGNEITSKELKKLIDSDAKIIMLDVRELDQRAEGEILAPPSGENIAITRGSLEFEVTKKIKDKEAFIVTYCRGGFRCAMSAQALKRLGYKNVKSLQGGVKGWLESGYSVETPMGSLILKK